MDTNNQLVPAAMDQNSQNTFKAGKWTGVAICALAAACIAPVNLLGLEKTILAMTLGILAVRNTERGTRYHRFGLIAIGISSLMVITWVILLTLYADQFPQLLEALSKLG